VRDGADTLYADCSAPITDAHHDVTAFVRDRRRLKLSGHRASIVDGDVLDQVAVRSALRPGFDTVVVAIGARALKPSSVVADGMHGILAGMKDCGIGRLLGVSGTAEMPRSMFFGRLTTALLKVTAVGHAIRDHDRALERVQHSGLRWTLVGCP
jgi:uncharacterized protein